MMQVCPHETIKWIVVGVDESECVAVSGKLNFINYKDLSLLLTDIAQFVVYIHSTLE